jgi:multidrug resistance efflux pump
LTSVGFGDGDDVQQGQVLFTLHRRRLEAALQRRQTWSAASGRFITSNRRSSGARDLSDRGIATPSSSIRAARTRPRST